MPGLSWSRFRSPVWETQRETSDSGREFTWVKWTTPKWQYKLVYELLRAGQGRTELQTMMGFFNQMYGDGDTWLYDDPDDNTATAQEFGVGDATTLAFQLVRTFGGFSEPVFELNGAPTVYVNGVVTSVTVSTHTGIVTFATPPAAGAALTWTGQFYLRCRFLKSSLEFEQFMYQFWTLKTLEFITVKP